MFTGTSLSFVIAPPFATRPRTVTSVVPERLEGTLTSPSFCKAAGTVQANTSPAVPEPLLYVAPCTSAAPTLTRSSGVPFVAFTVTASSNVTVNSISSPGP